MDPATNQRVASLVGCPYAAIVLGTAAAWKTYQLKSLNEPVPIGTVLEGGLEVIALTRKPDPSTLMFMQESCADLRVGRATHEDVRAVFQ